MNQGSKDAGSQQIKLSPVVKAKLAAREYIHKGGWNNTPAQRLASERNWCRYMLAGMEGMIKFMTNRGWLNKSAAETMNRAISTARWSVDIEWDVKIKKITKKSRW